MESWLEVLQADYDLGTPTERSPEGLLRAIATGYFVAAGLLSQLEEKRFVEKLKEAVYAYPNRSAVQEVQRTVDMLDESKLGFEQIKAFASEAQVQRELELVFLDVYNRVVTNVENPVRELGRYMSGEGSSKGLKLLAKEMMIALDVKYQEKTSPSRPISPAAYVCVAVTESCVYSITPKLFDDMLEMKRLEPALYANYDKQFNAAIVGFAKALASVTTVNAECILLHSQLRSLLLEAVKFDLPLEIPRIITATNFKFVPSHANCEAQERKIQLECGHWKCKECLMVEIYSKSQYFHVPEHSHYWELGNCCKVKAEQIKELLSDEEVQALHLELEVSPPS